MMLLKKLKNKKLFHFNNIKIFTLIAFVLVLANKYETKTIVNINKSLTDYELMFTYYYSGDATGSGNTTASGIGTSSFTVDSNGWYHYNYNGTDYLVVAAALKTCRDSSNHCGIDVEAHGIASSIPYYDLYDTLKLKIGSKVYDAIVLDACGACMWQKQDSLGEKIDIYAANSSAVNPGIYNSTGQNLGTSHVGNSSINTSYSGDLEKGYIYQTQYNKSLKLTDSDKLEQRIMNIINNIFDAAGAYTGGYNSDYEIITGSTDALNWKQYDSSWGHVRLGNSSSTIKSAGCLATSVAIQIKNSNTKLTTDNFNPGTFVNYLTKNNGFERDLFRWNGAWKGLAPNFDFVSKEVLPSSKQGKITRIKQLLNNGYYPVMCVKRNCKHWVAVVGVEDNNIIIADPGATVNTVWPKYNAISNDNTLRVVYFKKND